MIIPKVITDSIVEPISVEYLKAHSHIDTTAQDDVIGVFIGAARRFFEAKAAYTVHEKTLKMVYDRWPRERFIELPHSTPLIDVDFIKYTDSSENEQTWAQSNTTYLVDTDNMPGRVVLAYNAVWPSFIPSPRNPIQIQYRAGIETGSPTTTDAPEDLRQLIAFLASHFYEHRDAVVIGDVVTVQSSRVELTADALIQRFIQYRF